MAGTSRHGYWIVFSFSLGHLVALLIADSDLETVVRSVRAVATDRGGEVRSVNRTRPLYSITAIMRDDQLGRLEKLLASQPESVTWEYGVCAQLDPRRLPACWESISQ